MKLRLIGCAALVAAASMVPSASARPLQAQRSQDIATGVATSIASEIAKSGIKAGVAHFAPDLTKYVDPTAHGLAQIQEQLAQLDNKLTQLQQHQIGLEAHLNCVTQRVALTPVVADAQATLESVTNAAKLPTTDGRSARFAGLFARIDELAKEQLHLHTALIGPDGAIRACAQHIEAGMRPYVTYLLARNVHDFYATYHAAAVALLVVRTNLMALHPEQFTEAEVVTLAKRVEAWNNEELSYIKPAFPDTMAYDTTDGWLWWREPISFSNEALRHKLAGEGWHITGFSGIPTCTAIAATLNKTGLTLGAARNRARTLGFVNLNQPWVRCYDDHDNLTDFNIDKFEQQHFGYAILRLPSLAARPNNGLVTISSFTYLK